MAKLNQRMDGIAGGLILLHTALFSGFMIGHHLLPELAWVLNGTSFRSWLSGGAIMQGLLILLPAVVILLLARLRPEEIGAQTAGSGSMILAAAAGIPAAILFQATNNLFLYGLSQLGIAFSRQAPAMPLLGQTEIHDIDAPRLILALLVSCLLPAVCEELFYRGIIQSALASRMRPGSAIFWQGISFALFHADPRFLLAPFLAGWLLGFLRSRSASLWPAMLTHATMNLSLFFLPPLLPRFDQAPLLAGARHITTLLYTSLVSACLAAAALLPLLVVFANLFPARRQNRKSRPDWLFWIALALQLTVLLIV